MVLTRFSHSGSRKVPRRSPSSSSLGKSVENPISINPIDSIPLVVIPSSVLIPFTCSVSPSFSSVRPKVPKVETVSTGPSTVVSYTSPPSKPVAAPVAPSKTLSPPVSTIDGASLHVSPDHLASPVFPRHRVPFLS